METKNTEGMEPKATAKELKAENAKLKKTIAELQKMLNKSGKQAEARLDRIRKHAARLSDELTTTQEQEWNK